VLLAFDTATDVATSALVADGDVLAQRVSVARTLLADVDALLRETGTGTREIGFLVAGTGPGSFTGTRIGLAIARGLALALDVPVAGISTLDALASATPEAFPVIDARRGEVFVPGPRAVPAGELEVDPGTLCVGSGAVRYREELEARGAEVPPDDSELHVPWARLHAALAREFGAPDDVLPIYVRQPDAEANRWK
jgi:tRNA threonylcarbamoyladenosine biosynthesis protein TsaB